MKGASFGEGIVTGLKTGGMGAITGGMIGGITGGLNALKHGGNFWTGKGAKFSFASTAQVKGRSDPVEYSNESAKEFSKKYIGDDPKGLNKLYADGTAPDDYTVVDGFGVSPDGGGYEQWVTIYQGKGTSDVYLFEAAFQSHEQLYLVMKHEYMHVTYENIGMRNYNK